MTPEDYTELVADRLRETGNQVQTVPVKVMTFATNKLVRRFSAFAWPAAVDLSQQKTFQHQGRVTLGGIYAGWLRERSAIALPEPRP